MTCEPVNAGIFTIRKSSFLGSRMQLTTMHGDIKLSEKMWSGTLWPRPERSQSNVKVFKDFSYFTQWSDGGVGFTSLLMERVSGEYLKKCKPPDFFKITSASAGGVNQKNGSLRDGLVPSRQLRRRQCSMATAVQCPGRDDFATAMLSWFLSSMCSHNWDES